MRRVSDLRSLPLEDRRAERVWLLSQLKKKKILNLRTVVYTYVSDRVVSLFLTYEMFRSFGHLRYLTLKHNLHRNKPLQMITCSISIGSFVIFH